MNWPDVPIKDVCLLAVDCVNKTAPVVEYETPYRMLRTTNVRGGFVDAENTRFVTEETFVKWTRRGVPQKGDVILTREAPLGDVGRLTSENTVFLGQRLFMYRADPEQLNSQYLAYVLQSPLVQGRIKSKGFGATVEHARVGDCENLLIPVPDITTQERVGTILAAYDDLIENNKRRIELLEESARQLYKEWFVRFRFPGHEHVKIIDGVPEGWELKLFEEVAEVRNGFAFKSGDYSSEGMPVIRTRDFSSTRYVYRDEDIRIPEYMLEKYKKYQLNRLDFLLIMVGASLGRFGIVTEKDLPALQNQNMWAIYTKNEAEFPQVYLIEMMQNLIDKFLNYRVGAAREFFRKDFVKKQKIIVPPRKLLNEFVDTSGGVYRQIETLLVQSEKLTKARDLLLPKLMSGEIAV